MLRVGRFAAVEEPPGDLVLRLSTPGKEFKFLLSSDRLLNYGLAGGHNWIFNRFLEPPQDPPRLGGPIIEETCAPLPDCEGC